MGDRLHTGIEFKVEELEAFHQIFGKISSLMEGELVTFAPRYPPVMINQKGEFLQGEFRHLKSMAYMRAIVYNIQGPESMEVEYFFINPMKGRVFWHNYLPQALVLVRDEQQTAHTTYADLLEMIVGMLKQEGSKEILYLSQIIETEKGETVIH